MIGDHWGTALSVGGFALVASMWQQVRAGFDRMRSFVFVRVQLQGELAVAAPAYCWHHFRRSPFGDRLYEGTMTWVRSVENTKCIAYEIPSTQSMVFWKGIWPIFMGSGMGISSNGQSIPTSQDSGKCHLSYLRWTLDIDELILAALDLHEDRVTGRSKLEAGTRFRIKKLTGTANTNKYGSNNDPRSDNEAHPKGIAGRSTTFPSGMERILRYKDTDIGPPLPKDPANSIIIPAGYADAITEFQKWLDARDWYAEVNIPWRRGFLLHGPPGTGKTSLVRMLAQLGRMPLFSFDLATMSNYELQRYWDEVTCESPCIALIEDIDAVFDGRENILGDQGGGLTFDCLLNCLSGVSVANGVFTIVTTNHPEKLDAALGVQDDGMSTRPGRLDRVIEIPPFDDDSRRRLATRILARWPDAVDEVIRDTNGFTAAQMTEICVQYALTRFWKE